MKPSFVVPILVLFAMPGCGARTAVVVADGAAIAVCTTAQAAEGLRAYQAHAARKPATEDRARKTDLAALVLDLVTVVLEEVRCVLPPAADLARQAAEAKAEAVRRATAAPQ